MYVHAVRAELKVRGASKTTDLLTESLDHLSVDIKCVATTAQVTAQISPNHPTHSTRMLQMYSKCVILQNTKEEL